MVERSERGRTEPGRQERGRLAEQHVADELIRRGFEVIGRNVRVGRLEIDIVARHGAVLALVEVRARGEGAWASGAATVTRSKQDRLRRAAAVLWASRFSKWPNLERVRFDVASVAIDDAGHMQTDYLEAAFV